MSMGLLLVEVIAAFIEIVVQKALGFRCVQVLFRNFSGSCVKLEA